MLWLESGGVFAVGRIAYTLLPPDNPKLNLRLEIEGVLSLAVVDTAAPYLVCSLALGEQLDLSKAAHLGSAEIRTYRGIIRGALYRLSVKLIATEGSSAQFEATAVVPEPDQDHWRDAPTFLGFQGCLERVRFAIDPSEDRFYFGPCP